jgi:hypothetical protein
MNPCHPESRIPNAQSRPAMIVSPEKKGTCTGSESHRPGLCQVRLAGFGPIGSGDAG